MRPRSATSVRWPSSFRRLTRQFLSPPAFGQRDQARRPSRSTTAQPSSGLQARRRRLGLRPDIPEAASVRLQEGQIQLGNMPDDPSDSRAGTAKSRRALVVPGSRCHTGRSQVLLRCCQDRGHGAVEGLLRRSRRQPTRCVFRSGREWSRHCDGLRVRGWSYKTNGPSPRAWLSVRRSLLVYPSHGDWLSKRP